MNGLFYGCSSLKSLPDISNWKTSKVQNINCLFYECPKLESITDISNWNTNNINDMISYFMDVIEIFTRYFKMEN